MRESIFWLLFFVIALEGCETKRETGSSFKEYTKIRLLLENTTPTVDIPECTLVTNNSERDSIQALELLDVKRKIPLAMQGKDSLLFDQILARQFTFIADSTSFFNRKDYINDRMHGTWTIDTVRYENMILQFLRDDLALLTYKNVLQGTDDQGIPDIEYYSWADIFIREDDQWKFLAIHNVDGRVEYPKTSD